MLLLFATVTQQVFAQSQISWNFVGPSASQSRVLALAVDPRNDSLIYLAAPSGGLWKTDNRGASWQPQIEFASSLQACSLAIDPNVPDVVYLGTGDDQNPRPTQGVARTNDRGQNWNFGARFTNQPVCALAIDPSDSTRVFAGSAEGLFLSTDSGGNWIKVFSSSVTSIAFDGAGNIYAGTIGTDHILTSSANRGSTWTNVSLQGNPNAASGLQANWVSIIGGGGAVSVVVSYAGSSPSPLDFYRSEDAGKTWSSTFNIGQARPPMALLADATGTLYVAGSSLLQSTNKGAIWQAIPVATGDYHAAIWTGGFLLLAGERGLEAVTVGGGAPAPAIAQLPLGQFLKVAGDANSNIWAAGPAGLFGPFVPSRTVTTSVTGIGAVGNVVAAATGSNNIFVSGNTRIYSSTDGNHFTGRTVIATAELRAPFPPLLIDPFTTTTAYVAGQRVYRTTNSGAAWTPMGTVDPDPTHVVIALAMPPASRTILYAATACLPEVAQVSCPATSFVWRSPNFGTTWVQTGVVSGFINRLAVDPRQPNTIYAAIGGFPAGTSLTAGFIAGDVLQSTNGGMAWTSIRGNLPKISVNALVIDSTSLPAQFFQPAPKIYIATDAGVFVTFNANAGSTTSIPIFPGIPGFPGFPGFPGLPGANTGANMGVQWTDISDSVIRPLPASPVTDIALLPNGLLVAATYGRGVYSTNASGLVASLVVNPLLLDVTLAQGAAANTAITFTNISSTTTSGWRLSAMDSWITIAQPVGTIGPMTSAQAAVRISAAGLQAGTYVTHVELVSQNIAQNIPIHVHVTGAPAKITILSGDNTSGSAGAALPPLQVMVSDSRQLPLPGVTVQFSIVSGGGALSARTAQTNVAGVASTVLTLPSDTGVVKVMAVARDLSATFTITAVPAPSFFADSVFDGVTLNVYTSLGPGSIVTIFGQNLAEGNAAAGTASLPTVLQTTRVMLVTAAGDVALPLLSVSPLQVRALLPLDLQPGTYLLRVQVGAGVSSEMQITTAPFAPGIFTINGSGRGPGVFVKNDGSVVTAANPADRGSTVTFYAAGLGPVTPAIPPGQAGAITEPLNRTVRTPRVLFDTYQAQVIYSGLALGLAGRYQVTVRVPTLISPATNVSVSLTIGGFASNRVTIPVR